MAAAMAAPKTKTPDGRRRSKSMELLQTSEYDNTSTDMRMDKVPDALRDESPNIQPLLRAKPTFDKCVTPAFPDGLVPYQMSKELFLAERGLNDLDAEALAGLLALNVASKLHAGKNSLGDAAAIRIAEALKANTSLTSLSLVNNKIGDAGGKAIAEAIKATSAPLVSFFGTNNEWSAATIKALTAANEAREIPMAGLNGLVL